VKKKRRALTHEARITLVALGGGLPAVLVALLLIGRSIAGEGSRWLLGFVVVASWLGGVLALRGRFIRPLQTLSNMVAALREGDFSIRARGADTRSPLGLAFLEINALADTMRRQRLDVIEAVTLLRQVMEAIDVAVFAFDDAERLQLVNSGGERLLSVPAERLVGRTAAELGLGAVLQGETPRLVDLEHVGRAGRWELRRGRYRWEGLPHTLVVLSDLTLALREEERVAWQRLVRVLSHEINNSLAPIKSLAGSLRTAAERRAAAGTPAPGDADLFEGLGVIEGRAAGLGRFVQAYARLARLPRPQPAPVEVEAWVRRVAALETRIPVTVAGGPPVHLEADPDQLDAMLINLVRNAADAALETGGGARIRWEARGRMLALHIEDDGPGIADTANLFVPFFTTKEDGTGIGLTLARQIAESHRGTVTLDNRTDGRGAVATVRLPLG
jgi:nitrogen fixation/metabolism regulation signal transduction histidine kinase